MKKCAKCNNSLPLCEFRNDKSKKDGKYSSCNDCYRKKYGIIKGGGKPNYATWHLEVSTGYIRKGNTRQHRHIMEEHLGRKLESWEHVHHINHDKTDNRIENLVVLAASEHHKRHTGRERQGVITNCTGCGKEKYFSPCRTVTKAYRCKSCYSKLHYKRLPDHTLALPQQQII